MRECGQKRAFWAKLGLGGSVAFLFAGVLALSSHSTATDAPNWTRALSDLIVAPAHAERDDRRSRRRGSGDDRQAETALRSVGLTLNRNSLPFDLNGPWYTSGLRLGTPAVTTLGMAEAQLTEIADIITSVLAGVRPIAGPDGAMSKAKYELDEAVTASARSRVTDLLAEFPLYPSINLDIMSHLIHRNESI